jgi:hypothetical protein
VFTDAERMEGWDRRQAGELNRWIDLDVPTESGGCQRSHLAVLRWCRRLPFCVRSPGRAQDAFH